MNPDEQIIEETEEQTLRDYLIDVGAMNRGDGKGLVHETRAALELLRKQDAELLTYRDKEAERQAMEDDGSANVVELARLTGVYATALTRLDVAPDLVRTLVRDYASTTLTAYYGLKGGNS